MQNFGLWGGIFFFFDMPITVAMAKVLCVVPHFKTHQNLEYE